ncbi:CDP-diacylglycerol--serine O-phosphatidyltransferase [Geobacter sp. SVR]|uniref:CDP-diacylglycerol--serine O-phosphatidyltransferase n=1 Tax=Geobacter sp. SVR TaxID=2495594 RepID=UPI00143EF63D|nr:CDP-diacylglycerol--serine O-phosphatidyltransferase [Geobacter sp. SVR]BCS54490.1 CDP-diacylglycerol--serine O-phosphatidyltransferase [Geobacter sp. SVR]GCF87090.1 CDP-diacylglycerol--serine O-phosphatidyltransferase [Geobacter sp. SVR]
MNSETREETTEKNENIKRGIYILPNLVTTGSLFAGFYSLVSTLNGNYSTAAVWIFLSAICDGLDGKIARMTGSTSKFGVEYDSLADLVAFGVTPALMVYAWALKPFGRVGWLAAFLFVACGALRLARFNVQVNTVESKRFVGLPIPAAASMVASTVLFFHHFNRLPQELIQAPYMFKRLAVITLIYLLAFLMVSNFRYYSFKDPALIKRQPFGFLLLAIVVLIVVAAEPVVMTFAIMLCYVLSGPIAFLCSWPRRRRLEKAVHKGHEASHRSGEQ